MDVHWECGLLSSRALVTLTFDFVVAALIFAASKAKRPSPLLLVAFEIGTDIYGFCKQ
jgi:hypothetical protein